MGCRRYFSCHPFDEGILSVLSAIPSLRKRVETAREILLKRPCSLNLSCILSHSKCRVSLEYEESSSPYGSDIQNTVD